VALEPMVINDCARVRIAFERPNGGVRHPVLRLNTTTPLSTAGAASVCSTPFTR
jgi:hypothetical protein